MTLSGSVPSCATRNRAGPVCVATRRLSASRCARSPLHLDQPVGSLLAGVGDGDRAADAPTAGPPSQLRSAVDAQAGAIGCMAHGTVRRAALVCGRHGRIPNLVFVLRLAVDCRRVARSCRDLYRAAWARAKRADGWGPPSCLRKLGSAALQGRRCEGCFPRARHRPRGYSAAVFCCGGVFGVVTVVHQTLPPLKQVQEPPRHLRNRLIAVIGQVLGVRCNDVGTSVG